jgi:hypothetical protein
MALARRWPDRSSPTGLGTSHGSLLRAPPNRARMPANAGYLQPHLMIAGAVHDLLH